MTAKEFVIAKYPNAYAKWELGTIAPNKKYFIVTKNTKAGSLGLDSTNESDAWESAKQYIIDHP